MDQANLQLLGVSGLSGIWFPQNCFFPFGGGHTVPPVKPTHYPKRHLDRFSRFCTGPKCYAVQYIACKWGRKLAKLPIFLGISSPCRKRTEPWPYATCTKYSVTIASVVRKILSRTDRQTHVHTDVLITILSNRSYGRSKCTPIRVQYSQIYTHICFITSIFANFSPSGEGIFNFHNENLYCCCISLSRLLVMKMFLYVALHMMNLHYD